MEIPFASLTEEEKDFYQAQADVFRAALLEVGITPRHLRPYRDGHRVVVSYDSPPREQGIYYWRAARLMLMATKNNSKFVCYKAYSTHNSDQIDKCVATHHLQHDCGIHG